MLRLVVIHQLVLSLIVGPMLCCCATARLGRDAKPHARATASADPSHGRTCCGHGQKPSDGRQPKPTDPAKCPCKDSPAKATTVPEATVSATDTLSLVSAGLPTLDLPVLLDQHPAFSRLATRFDHRSSHLSADELLFAHHNLRC